MELPISYKRFLEQDRKLFTDSRNVLEGGIFVALHGSNFDGNEYAIDALEKGAAYAIVDRIIKHDPRLILVKDTLSELQEIGRINRVLNKAKVIAITGSNGKTTTKELTYSIFKRAYNTIATQGNFNNHIGVPLNLLRINQSTEFAIIEMGANQVGDIKQLCLLANPDIGLITNIGKAHLEGFGDLEGVTKTKFELFDYLKQHDGICVFNMDSSIIRSLFQAKKNMYCFGSNENDFEFQGELIRSFPSIEMKFRYDGEVIEINSQLFGEYNYQNILAAASLASICKIPMKPIKEGVEEYIPSNMRSQIIQLKGNTIIMDAYNANPASMKASIDIFNKMTFQNKWIVLGEMAELGVSSQIEHENLVQFVRAMNFNEIVFIGKQYQSYKEIAGLHIFDDVSTCKQWLEAHWPPEQTAILIKGSRSSALEKLIH